mgnify:CR=1 FL=1
MTTVEESGSGESYRAAGVDLDAGEEAVRRIGPVSYTHLTLPTKA